MKTAKELGITPTQRRNIARLTLFVKDAVPPPKFNIKHHHSVEKEFPSKATYECGTSACFCGYGPLAGIRPQKREDWFDYAGRTMTVSFESDVWDWLFCDFHENTKSAAVRRGAYFLMNGLPDCNLYSGEAPRSFRPDWEAIKKIAD